MSWQDRAHLLGKTEGEIIESRALALSTDDPFLAGESGLCLNLLPRKAIEMSCSELLELMRRRYGDGVDMALSPEWTDPDLPVGNAPDVLRGPVASAADTGWLKRTNMVGINVRTVGDFSGVVKYALTLSDAHDSIHLLPVWEPGVVGSLYGMSSRHINREFFSREMAALIPHLDTPERQLKATVNLLHCMGKAVGMDVIPHTDRYSEIVLAYPAYFEWLRREDTVILDHRANLHEEVEERILAFVEREGPAVQHASGDDRELLLFGPSGEYELRARRRRELSRYLYTLGYEPVPATMAPPYRGLVVDTDKAVRGSDGHVWREYRIARPESMSRVFGPLTRYKLYERLDDNREWQIDFSRPRRDVWKFVQSWYVRLQRSFAFDFMRGDMSHVQMRPEGVPAEPGEYYDLLGSVAHAVRRENEVPSFGYFAETFIAPPGVMAYGDEIDHLEASNADVTLGDLQSRRVDSAEFMQQLRLYRDIGDTRHVRPAFTVMTSDKDDPRFDDFYIRGNEVRYFTALFLTDMPSYTALNFEIRDPHHTVAVNEEYTKLYVFQEEDGPKATNGPFRFGRNGYLFFRISRIRLFAEEHLPGLLGRPVVWLLPPDPTGGRKYVAWTVGEMLFVVNFGEYTAGNVHIPFHPIPGKKISGRVVFSTDETRRTDWSASVHPPLRHMIISEIGAGEGLAIRCVTTPLQPV